MTTYILTTGSHDDYSVLGVFTGPAGVDVEELAKKWAQTFPDKAKNLGDPRNGKERFDDAHFREYVLKEAGLVRVASTELWLPDYSLDMKRYVEEK